MRSLAVAMKRSFSLGLAIAAMAVEVNIGVLVEEP
jgi:hypothetical protein